MVALARPLWKPPFAMTLSLDTYNTLLEALYNGAREDAPWALFLNQLCELTGSRLTVLNLARPRPGDPGVVFIGGADFDREHRLQYANDFSALDPFVNLPDGEAITLSEVLSPEQLRQTAFYREFMQPTDLVQILGIDIPRDGRPALFLRAIRSERAAPFGEQEKALFNLLAPHLRQLQSWLDQTRQQGFELGIYDGIASRLEIATILLDAGGRILHCNPVARALLSSSELIAERQGRLAARRSGDQQRLQALLAECAGTPENSPTLAPALRMETESPNSGLYLLLKPLPAGAEAGLLPPDLIPAEASADGPRIAVYISTPEILSPEQQGILQQLFDFTPSEAQLAISLANGMSLEQIAEERCVSRNTLRTHLRGAFQKSGVNQQSALVSLVLRSVAGLG
ncbi:helix-turn-helix transcriptional regulator [Parahaliea aestuarii]|uniref:Helix-turn-helix transcriptional regulator n=1 Tax=Parahaliea aestuarii TaxID=1852021 RepID=A0A5C9A129_9GAMM|nr:helix-turn-helix transcriptional regulator [Parahaliea aestuarii]TXS94466.1 helix-turn-helix transcriptional regulator [Parahaliea aestuarii]